MALKEIFRTRDEVVRAGNTMKSTYKWLTEDLKPNTVAIEIGVNAIDSAMYLAKFENIATVYIMGHDHNKAKKTTEGTISGRKIINTTPRINHDDPKALRHYITHNSGYSWPIILRCDVGGNEEKLFRNLFNGMNENDILSMRKMMFSLYGTENAMEHILKEKGFNTAYRPINGILSKRTGTLYAWR